MEVDQIRKDERRRIATEIRMRCEALRHPNPCWVCDPFLRIVGDKEDDG